MPISNARLVVNVLTAYINAICAGTGVGAMFLMLEEQHWPRPMIFLVSTFLLLAVTFPIGSCGCLFGDPCCDSSPTSQIEHGDLKEPLLVMMKQDKEEKTNNKHMCTIEVC